jgi:ABC-type bacteriocin/lantibiotic exporter with double-glycine peptidase domain
MIYHVGQADPTGCGVACLAMVLGVSYADARERLFGRSRTRSYGVDRNELNAALRAAGFGTRLVPAQGLARPPRGRYPRIVGLTWSVRVDGLEGGHWVVWDPDQPGHFLDPDPDAVPLVPVRKFLPAIRRCGEPHLVVRVT